MPLTFNIVYTPGTVRHLSTFVASLLQWSDCSFRLVSNGCSAQENHLLEALCAQDPRLEFCLAPFKSIVYHGQVLGYLQAMNDAATFCFMDSDIFASGEFIRPLLPYLTACAGVFSGSPLWQKAEDQVLPVDFPRVFGHFNRTPTGLCLGSTYFAIYDNRILTQFIRSTGIDFKRYWWEEIPAHYQEQLVRLGIRRQRYDTGKVLNLLLLAQGRRLHYGDVPQLQHVGGISRFVLQREALHRGRIARLTRLLPDGGFKRRFWAVVEKYKLRTLHQTLTKSEAQACRESIEREGTVSRYFGHLLKSQLDHTPRPAMPKIGDREVEQKVTFAAAEIVKLYVNHGQNGTDCAAI